MPGPLFHQPNSQTAQSLSAGLHSVIAKDCLWLKSRALDRKKQAEVKEARQFVACQRLGEKDGVYR
jgi:hypothetical protein